MKKPAAELAGLLLLLLLATPALGDGFHSPLLRNPDPRKWAQTERERLGLDKSDSADTDDSGRGFRRRGVVKQLVDVLRYLDRKNVLLREFPDFNYDDIPKFKSETEALLIAIGKDAVPLLLSVLLTDLKNGDATEPQFAGLRRSDDLIERLIRILIAIGEDSLDHVIAGLIEEHPRVRRAMIRILREIVEDPDFGADVEDWRRWHTIWRAGRDRKAASLTLVMDAIEDRDRRIRLVAVRSLGEIGSRKAVAPLLKALDGERDERVVVAIARSLAKIGDVRAAPALIDLLEASRSSLRGEAITALRFLTRTMKGFEPRATAPKRAQAVARWRDWWEKR